jgi:acetate kinase
MADRILCLNAGSSSLKFALFMAGDPGNPIPVVRGGIENIGLEPHLVARDGEGRTVAERRWPKRDGITHETLLSELLDWVEQHGGHTLLGVGHRVVHGGTRFTSPIRIEADDLAALDALCPLAPLHQPHNLAAIRAIAAVRPGLTQIACFDTSFHRQQPLVATRLALPHSYEKEGIRRYGFHGLSYEYIARRLTELDPTLAAGRVIAAHLGNGASLCGMRGGGSVDTTMGFTALDGLVMGTRCGTIDPGVILYLLQQKGLSADEVEQLLYHRSGLIGVSGISSDMRALLASDDPHAAEAIDLFVYRLAREAGALASSLGGIDGIVFTAGIGENAPEIRSRSCARLRWLGVTIDEEANRRGDAIISIPASAVVVRIMPTDEESMIALHAAELLMGGTIRSVDR